MSAGDRALEVLLISPPIASVVRPNMGLSALKAALGERGIAAGVWYLNMDFADRVGVAVNEWLAISSPVNLLLGEWIFSAFIRGPGDPTHDLAYADEVVSRLPRDAPCDATVLRMVRAAADAFLDDVARRIVEVGPRIVGVSTTFQQTCAGLAIARRVKARDPTIVICFGGANCDHPMGEALASAFAQIDHVFSGESDRTFPDFAAAVLAGRSPVPPRPRGRLPVAGEAGHGQVVRGEPIAALDEMPIPDMDDYFRDLGRQSFAARVRPALVFESSRGCWWGAKHHCTFCGLNANELAYRSKSAPRVLDELDRLATRHGVRLFEAVDNILNPHHIDGVFARLAEASPGYSFFYEVKTNMSHDQLVRAARAGLTYVQPGIESLHDHLLKLMAKGVSALQNVAFLRSCREIGIVPCWNMLHRFPGETAACYAEMVDLFVTIEHLDPPMSVSPVRLDRYSPYFERADAYGYQDVAPFEAYQRLFAVPAETAGRIAYFFNGHNPGFVPREAMDRFFQGLNWWKDRHQDAAQPPLLQLVESDGEAVVVDTRECARAPTVALDSFELRLLKHFRRPSSTERLEEVVGAGADAAFDHLRDLGYLIRIGDKAVSIVCESGWRIHADLLPYPGGSLVIDQPAASSPTPVADEKPSC